MQEDRDDELVDYNDDPEYMEIHGNPSWHTPTHSPTNLNSESEVEEEVKRDLEEGQKRDEDMRAAALARREKHRKELKLSHSDYQKMVTKWEWRFGQTQPRLLDLCQWRHLLRH